VSRQPHYDDGQLLVAESLRACGALECLLIDRPGMSSLSNPDARFAFTMLERSTPMDQRGIDLLLKVRAARRSHAVPGVPWEMAHAQNHQWENHLIQIKALQRGTEEHGRVVGLVLPLPDPLPQHLLRQLTSHMIQVAREHQGKYPYVNCLLFISAVTTSEERAKAHKMIWQEIMAMIGTREQLLCGHRFSDQPDPVSQP
jgi:hypothetical protein